MTAPAGGNAATSATLTVRYRQRRRAASGGGGALDWLDIMFVAGVLLVGARPDGAEVSWRRKPVRMPCMSMPDRRAHASNR